MEFCFAEGGMTLLNLVPLGSAVMAGAGIMGYLIYLISSGRTGVMELGLGVRLFHP